MHKHIIIQITFRSYAGSGISRSSQVGRLHQVIEMAETCQQMCAKGSLTPEKVLAMINANLERKVSFLCQEDVDFAQLAQLAPENGPGRLEVWAYAACAVHTMVAMETYSVSQFTEGQLVNFVDRLHQLFLDQQVECSSAGDRPIKLIFRQCSDELWSRDAFLNQSIAG